MATVKFFVQGQPVPKQSFRATVETNADGKITRRGGFTPKKVKAWAGDVGWAAKEYIRQPIPGNVAVHLDFFLVDNRVVDLDNLSKNVLDGLKNVAFGDDCKVVELNLKKCVDKKNPGVWVTIKPVVKMAASRSKAPRQFEVTMDGQKVAQAAITDKDDFNDFLVGLLSGYPDNFVL
jgi:Holliday junction resolvase RusA-like endonuclease